MSRMQPASATQPGVTLFLRGDVMTGRGVDQILDRPSKPHLHEQYVRSALGYVDIAERATGPIDRPAKPAYIWGDALAEHERVRPDARIINLETAVTTAEDAWHGKGIHYRMPGGVLDAMRELVTIVVADAALEDVEHHLETDVDVRSRDPAGRYHRYVHRQRLGADVLP